MWSLNSLQSRIRVKEVKITPHNHEDLTGVHQRRQEAQNAMTKYGVIPENLKLPYPIHKTVWENTSNYIRFRELISLGNIKAAKYIKDIRIKAYKVKVQVRRVELAQGEVDVNYMLRQIDKLHMGAMQLAHKVVIDNENSNIDIEIYPDGIPSPFPTLTRTSTTYEINRRGPIEASTSYINDHLRLRFVNHQTR